MGLGTGLTSRPARVLRVITRMNIGGPSLHVSILCSRLDRSRFTSLLLTGVADPAEGDMAALGRVELAFPYRRIPALRRPVHPLRDAAALIEIARIVRAYRPDIVHTHLAKAGAFGRLAARAARVPVIVHTYHGSVFHGYFGRTGSRAYLAIERALARISTALVAITPRQREELIRLRVAPADRIVEIPLGLDLAPFLAAPPREAARAALGLADDAFVVGLVGRLVPIKDAATFLRAFEILTRARPRARALVVGDGEERGRLERLSAELGIAARVRFLGWRADMATMYAALDVLALSSLNEGSPVSVIEAMASAIPVVATAVGGVPDLVQDGRTGVLVPAGDPDAMARTLAELAGDGAAAARMGTAGRASVHPRLDASTLVRDIAQLYDRLLRSGADRPAAQASSSL